MGWVLFSSPLPRPPLFFAFVLTFARKIWLRRLFLWAAAMGTRTNKETSTRDLSVITVLQGKRKRFKKKKQMLKGVRINNSIRDRFQLSWLSKLRYKTYNDYKWHTQYEVNTFFHIRTS